MNLKEQREKVEELLKLVIYGDSLSKSIAFTQLLNFKYKEQEIKQLCIDRGYLKERKGGSKNKKATSKRTNTKIQ